MQKSEKQPKLLKIVSHRMVSLLIFQTVYLLLQLAILFSLPISIFPSLHVLPFFLIVILLELVGLKFATLYGNEIKKIFHFTFSL